MHGGGSAAVRAAVPRGPDPAEQGGTPVVHLPAMRLLPDSSATNVSLLDAAAWSSAFWAATIVDSKAAYAAEKAAELLNLGVLISANAEVSKHWGARRHQDVGPASEDPFRVHLVDGGMVDTTGIVAMLQRGVSRILALYNNNDDLAHAARDKNHSQSEQASVAYLFGVDVVTDSMNSLAGPKLTQVFPANLYPAVIANLTNGQNFARLVNVPVYANHYLGIAANFTLDELIITANQPSDNFLDSFADTRIRAAVNPLWPNRMPLGLSAFDANLMCQFERWKLQQHRERLLAFFSAAGEASDSDTRVVSHTQISQAQTSTRAE